MIKVHIKYQDDKIRKIIMNGHSGYSESGSDIVCASASTIAITSVDAILKFDEDAIFYKQDEGFLEITINHVSKEVKLILENMIELLEELSSNYPKYIKIDKEVS